ncbi:MAG: hypothetical protein WBG66_21670 [Geitlerinemataceae cyanobacterium]
MEQFEFDRFDRESPVSDASYDIPQRDRLNEELHALIREGLPHPPNSPQRRKIVNRIVRKIQQSGKLLRSSSPHYEDALSDTWRYFLRNLWEADTADPFSDPACKILNRLNKYLKFRVQDADRKAREEWQKRQQSRSSDGEWQDIAETLPAPEPDAQIEQLRELIHTDPTGELRTTHVRRKLHVTVQLLLQPRANRQTPRS